MMSSKEVMKQALEIMSGSLKEEIKKHLEDPRSYTRLFVKISNEIDDMKVAIPKFTALKNNILKEDDKTNLMCLSGVKQYPMRVKCATLSWHTLVSAMENDGKEIMATNLVVRPRRNENIERVIKRFNKKVKKLGIIDDYKDSSRYMKPSEKRRRAKKRSDRRRAKEMFSLHKPTAVVGKRQSE